MGIITNRRRVMGGNPLPYDAVVEYLESTGSQYIDTGIRFNGAMNIKCIFKNTDVTTTQRDRRIFGGSDGWQTKGVSFAENSFTFFNKSTFNISIYNNASIHTLTFINRVLRLDSTSIITFTANYNTAETTITLFAEHRPTGHSSYLKGEIMAFSIGFNSDANNIIDLIPVRVGQVGYMYDRVSGQLFGNAGTGAFIVGPDVN